MQRRIPPHPSSLFGRGYGHELQVLEALVAVTGLGLGDPWLRVTGIRRLSELGVVGALRLFLEQAHYLLFHVMKLGLDHECPCLRQAYERHLDVVWVWVILEVFAQGRQRMMW